MRVVIGVSGVQRNAAVAACREGRVVAACEQERFTRVRGVGVLRGGFPTEAMDAALSLAGCSGRDDITCAMGEEMILPSGVHPLRFDHQLAHAMSAFYTSPFQEAVVLVCGRSAVPEVSIWEADTRGIRNVAWPWQGLGFTRLYSQLTEAMGFSAGRDEHRLEALARVGNNGCLDKAPSLIGIESDRLWVDSRLRVRIDEWSQPDRPEQQMSRKADVASTLQSHVGDLLLQCLRKVRARLGGANLCLSGGLFYNTNLNTKVQESGIFEQIFIPVHPGNAGLAVGCALGASPHERQQPTANAVWPYLGPEYDLGEIKAVLDNCKLSYEYANEGTLIEEVVKALRRGLLVGWFQGRMEWGPRALGNRSILANPLAPYVLENLNVFLKQREPYRSYAVSVCEEDVDCMFDGPSASPFMQFEHRATDPARLRQIMPCPNARLRVHTLGSHPALLRKLLKAFGNATGTPLLVNTSFNGFQEPIVCTPRDAVRVFYGTGIDMLAIENFILRK